MTTPPKRSSRTAGAFAQEDPSSWRKPSQAQRLSNRVILRAQQLANELRDDLNTLSFFKEAAEKAGMPENLLKNVVESVVFVCPDPKSDGTTYYLPRLLNTFDLEQPGLWPWIVEHQGRFQPLFDLHGAKTGYQSFLEAIEQAETATTADPTKAKRRRAVVHDLLIDQIATLPYQGLLPELWEEFFFRRTEPGWSPRACWCHVRKPEKANGESRDQNDTPPQPVEMWRFDGLRPGEKWGTNLPNVQIRASDEQGVFDYDVQKHLRDLYRDFVDPFLLGIHEPHGDQESDSPYFKTHQYGEVRGIAVPVYEWFPREGLEPCGGFIAWLFVIPKQEDKNLLEALFPSEISNDKEPHASWLGLSFCVRKFATRLRQLQRREALEHRGRRGGGALELTKELSHYFTGWRRSVLDWNPKFADGEFFKHEDVDDTHRLAIDVSPTLGLGLDERGSHLPVLLEPLPGTIIPEDAKSREDYLVSQAEAVRAFYRDAARLEAERRLGKLSGEVASAHDYSKDLNALDSQLARFSKELSQTREHFQHARTDSVADLQSEIQERLGALKVPEEWWLLRARFMMAHQRTETEGRLYEQPEWCLDLIKRGTRGALIRLVKLLVWHPIDWEEHVKHASLTLSGPQMDEDQAELSPRHLSDWSRLFSYDERGRYAEIDKILGNYMRFMFVEERIEEEAFWTRHPPPKLNGDSLMTAQLLWADMPDGGKTRWRPVGTLCPLLVFSLRAAYQHAWLDGFLRAAVNWEGGASMKGFLPKTPSVTLKSMDDGTGFYLTFPDPQTRIFENGRPGQMEGKIRLPWGTWERDLSRYEGLCHPWQRKLIREPASNDFQIQITTQ